MSLLVLLLALQQSIIILHFKLNQDFIEQNYCINKARPQLNCHGKCQLEKELKNTTEPTSVQGFSLYEPIVFPPISAEYTPPILRIFYTPLPKTAYSEKLKLQTFIRETLRPPTVSFVFS